MGGSNLASAAVNPLKDYVLVGSKPSLTRANQSVDALNSAQNKLPDLQAETCQTAYFPMDGNDENQNTQNTVIAKSEKQLAEPAKTAFRPNKSTSVNFWN